MTTYFLLHNLYVFILLIFVFFYKRYIFFPEKIISNGKSCVSRIARTHSIDDASGVMLKTSLFIFGVSFYYLIILLALVGFVFGIAYHDEFLFGLDFNQTLLSLTIASFTSLIAFLFIKKRLKSKVTNSVEEYPLLSQILHLMILKFNSVSDILFYLNHYLFRAKIQELILKRKGESLPDIFVMGMARSGTTLILNILHEADNGLASLKYKDMPFIAAPNLWSALSKRSIKKQDLKERSHGDGIKIDVDSVEAFEEVFWNVFSSRDDVYEKFEVFRSSVCLARSSESNKVRYLSKNNSNITRLGVMSNLGRSVFLIVFRNPLEVAISSLNMHIKYTKLDKEDKFINDYMALIHHYEFGVNHFRFGDYNFRYNNPFDLNYWLEYWLVIHEEFLVNIRLNSKFILVDYNDLLDRPDDHLKKLSRIVGIPALSFASKSKIRGNRPMAEGLVYDCDLLNECKEVYSSLKGACNEK
jgi:hypothetical protein